MAMFNEPSCAGKVAFDSQEIANKAARRSKAKRRAPRAPYKCATCKKWHVGSFSRFATGRFKRLRPVRLW